MLRQFNINDKIKETGRSLTEAVFILNQCSFFIGMISSAVIAVGNIQQDIREEYECTPCPSQPVIVDCAEAVYKEPVIEEESVPETAEDNYEEYCLPETESVFSDGFDSSFKAYMDYRRITDTGSVQYEMQQQAYTDSRGFRRIGDDYCVALGTGFTYGCGERFMIYLDSGYSFSAVVADVKSDAHTDSTNCYVPRGENSGNVVEFIIDSDCAESSMLSSGNAGYYEDLSGNVTAVVPV